MKKWGLLAIFHTPIRNLRWGQKLELFSVSKIFGHTLVKIGKERRVSDIANRPIIDACILLYPNDLTRNKPCTKKPPKYSK